jgi:1-acyl-sn-glycerol-3-phosphate acyltransferase
VPDGPAVVAANHLSHVDPVFVSVIVDRPVRYLALDELYGNSWFFDVLTLWFGAIPVPRKGVPLGAMRTALAELDAGGTVGVFPEGARVQQWGERPAKRGAAWLAHRTGVPLVPVAVAGTDGVMGMEDFRIRRSPVTVTVCDAILPADFADRADPVGAMTDEWVRRIDAALGGGT